MKKGYRYTTKATKESNDGEQNMELPTVAPTKAHIVVAPVLDAQVAVMVENNSESSNTISFSRSLPTSPGTYVDVLETQVLETLVDVFDLSSPAFFKVQEVVEKPATLKYTSQGDTTVLKRKLMPNSSPAYVFILIYGALIMNGAVLFVAACIGSILLSENEIQAFMIPVQFFLAALGFFLFLMIFLCMPIYAVIVNNVSDFFNSTILTTTPEEVQVKVEPISMCHPIQSYQLDNTVREIRCKRSVTHSENGSYISYQVHIVRQNGEYDTIMTGLKYAEEALFIGQEIERGMHRGDLSGVQEQGLVEAVVVDNTELEAADIAYAELV